jgi:hypothetical protein
MARSKGSFRSSALGARYSGVRKGTIPAEPSDDEDKEESSDDEDKVESEVSSNKRDRACNGESLGTSIWKDTLCASFWRKARITQERA